MRFYSFSYIMLHFTSSERNKPVLNYNGYQYTFKRKGFTTNEWRYRQRTCSSTLSLGSDNIIVIRLPSAHSCPSLHASKQIIDEAVQRMEKRARQRQLLFQRYIQKNLFVHALQILVW